MCFVPMVIQFVHESINKSLFALVILSDYPDLLQGTLNRLSDVTESISMRVNVDKTKVSLSDREGANENSDFSSNEQPIDKVNECVQFGQMFTADGNINEKIERRVNAGTE